MMDTTETTALVDRGISGPKIQHLRHPNTSRWDQHPSLKSLDCCGAWIHICYNRADSSQKLVFRVCNLPYPRVNALALWEKTTGTKWRSSPYEKSLQNTENTMSLCTLTRCIYRVDRWQFNTKTNQLIYNITRNMGPPCTPQDSRENSDHTATKFHLEMNFIFSQMKYHQSTTSIINNHRRLRLRLYYLPKNHPRQKWLSLKL